MIRIATRKSALALWQAHYLADRLRSLPAAPEVELVPIVTIGDANQTDALRQFGGTGVFTLEVQKAVLDGRAEIAVHSLKDLPTLSADGLVLAAVPERERRCDALLLPLTVAAVQCLDDIPHGAKIGTGSPRRQAQLLHLRPDLKLCEIRGNVDTRIRKLDEGQYDAIVLAEAGLRRLELAGRISLMLEPPAVYPAVSQGALGIECRVADQATRALLQQITCNTTLAEVLAERSLLRTLRAGCHAPLGAWTQVEGERLTLTGVLLSLDGTTRLEQTASGSADCADQVGVLVAEQLLSSGAASLLSEGSSH
ncbi:MAG: hydroxymethylbilane synthase [Planctomycetota bacterium]|nr:hydroxymethylbilane synthase [Planctomycetales bacterium]RLT05279.1 MAG: hydroxymethylbilane synthase [Planctomycetota bacterium]